MWHAQEGEKCIQNLERAICRKETENYCVYGRIIMKWILKGTECKGADPISLVQDTGTSGGSCGNGKRASGFQ